MKRSRQYEEDLAYYRMKFKRIKKMDCCKLVKIKKLKWAYPLLSKGQNRKCTAEPSRDVKSVRDVKFANNYLNM